MIILARKYYIMWYFGYLCAHFDAQSPGKKKQFLLSDIVDIKMTSQNIIKFL